MSRQCQIFLDNRPLSHFCSSLPSLNKLRNGWTSRPRRSCLTEIRRKRTEVVLISCRSQQNWEQSAGSSGSQQIRITSRRLLKQLSSLKLAIGELAAIAALSAVGTVIKQNETTEYYLQNYPALLAASLAACTTTRQWPMVKVARRWRLAGTVERLAGMGSVENSLTLPDARVQDFGRLLREKGYSIFLKKDSMYAFKGMAGRFAPIGVHASMLMIMLGVTLSSFCGSIGSVMVPEDGDFVITQALQPRSVLARPSKELGTTQLHVDDFEIEFRDDGSVGQYKSAITLTDINSGNTLQTKTISVNDPLRFKGMTAYQTDWSIAAVSLTVRNLSEQDAQPQALKLPVASLEGQEGISGKLWATFLPAQGPSSPDANPRGISLAMRDVQTIAIYDSKGGFVGIRRPESGKPITVEDLELVITDIIGSTGLELKSDPGIPYVYAGFGGMMITTALSYLSHSQIWALQEGTFLHISGKTNRAKNEFEQEIANLTELVPEHK